MFDGRARSTSRSGAGIPRRSPTWRHVRRHRCVQPTDRRVEYRVCHEHESDVRGRRRVQPADRHVEHGRRHRHEYMFQGATAFNQPIGTWNTARVTNMSHMFQGVRVGHLPRVAGGRSCPSSTGRIGAWNTAQVTDMSYMFEGAVRFNQPIGSWNTARVSSMQGMFEYASAFNQPIGTWDTARVSHMSALFYGAVRFNQPIGTWNTRAATNLSWMFGNGSGLSTSNYNQLLVGWAAKPQTRHVRLDAGIPPTTARQQQPTTPSASRMRGRSLMAAGRLTRPRHRSPGPRASRRSPTAEHSQTRISSTARRTPEAGST